MLWCDRVAPFGVPVVPEVYWMLMGSSKVRVASRAASSPSSTPAPASSSASHPSSSTTVSFNAGHSGRTRSTIST